MLKLQPTLLVLLTLVFAGCQSPSSREVLSESAADLIVTGQHILTMENDSSVINAIAVREGIIIAVGSTDEITPLTGPDTRTIELGDRALLPGFIDAHGHFSFVARMMDSANLSSPPVGTVKSIDDLTGLLSKRLPGLEDEQWLTGYGYDDSLLEEQRHPTRDDLDKVSKDRPIVLLHVSAHLAVANSKALELSGISEETSNPPGGVIRRYAGTQKPNGVLEESAIGAVAFGTAFNSTPEQFALQLNKAIDYHARYGVTTIQDGAATMSDVELMREIGNRDPYRVDIAAYVNATRMPDDEFEAIQHTQTYENGLRVAGFKFVLDGSPQGRTAWMTEPYTQGPPGVDENYVAYPSSDINQYHQRAEYLLSQDIPFLAHANGDAAIDAMLDGLEQAGTEAYESDHRTVIIHAQVMRDDQIPRIKKLNAVPSFFSAHTFFWGDWHRLSFGDHRAMGISPASSSLKAGIPITIHNDAPIIPPDMMRLVWATVNRESRDGVIIGEDERLTVEQALHAITKGAAYQYFEEEVKGSIAVGKQADLVILEQNPLLVEKQDLADVKIIETIARGISIYKNE